MDSSGNSLSKGWSRNKELHQRIKLYKNVINKCNTSTIISDKIKCLEQGLKQLSSKMMSWIRGDLQGTAQMEDRQPKKRGNRLSPYQGRFAHSSKESREKRYETRQHRKIEDHLFSKKFCNMTLVFFFQ